MTNDTTLRDAVEMYVSRQFIAGMRDRSADQLRFTVNAVERLTLGAVTLGQCTTPFLCDWITKRLRAGISKATAKRDRGNLLAILKYAMGEGWPGPLPSIPRIRVETKMPQAWTVEEVSTLISTALALEGNMRKLPITRAWFFGSLLLFLYDTGLRVRSALSLKTADVWLNRGAALVRAESDKTWTDQIVKLSPEVLAMFKEGNLASRDRVWPYPYALRNIWEELRDIVKRAGLPTGRQFGFHRMRRAHATQAVIAAGWSAASKSLGHSSVKMTRSYVDLSQLAETNQVEIPRPNIKLGKPAKRRRTK